MAVNGVSNYAYNYNNASVNPEKHNSENENGINMGLVSQGRFIHSMETNGSKYYGVSYTAEMQAQGKIGIPDEDNPGKMQVVDVTSKAGKARLKELEKERASALAEVKKYDAFVGAESSPSKTDNDNSGIVSDFSQSRDHSRYNSSWAYNSDGRYSDHGRHGSRHGSRYNRDPLNEARNGMQNNRGAFEQMLSSRSRTQNRYGGNDSGLSAMMREFTTKLRDNREQNAGTVSVE